MEVIICDNSHIKEFLIALFQSGLTVVLCEPDEINMKMIHMYVTLQIKTFQNCVQLKRAWGLLSQSVFLTRLPLRRGSNRPL